ncbi:MAG: hypothetical protein LAO21_06775 [Acidobacteriia bacterium]|nr:hypothetical protein [Terriglobia bacterium]
MKFSEIANRLTGISTPLVGVSWQPSDLEVSAARRVIEFLEDRRVLYAPEEMEVASHCVHSVLEIRHFLSGELGKLGTKSEFAASLRAMRAACRKFLDRVGVDGRETVLYANHHGHWASWTFYSALGRGGAHMRSWHVYGFVCGSARQELRANQLFTAHIAQNAMYAPPNQMTRRWNICALLLLMMTSGLVQAQTRSGPLKVTFCDLYQQPDKYAGKIIEIHAAVYGYRDPTLEEAAAPEPCLSYMTIGLEFPQNVKPKPDFDVERDESFQKFKESWEKGMRVITIFESRFDPVFTWRDHKRVRVGEGQGFGKKHSQDGRLVLCKVSDVKALYVPRK